jgi:hypothetical protein
VVADRAETLPARYLAGIGAATVALIAVPYGEELARCLLAARRRAARSGRADARPAASAPDGHLAP